MISEGALQRGALHNRSPDDVQREASDPRASVWVGASAGTGKTKVLTDRLLRLLLPQGDGTAGTEPHRVLCLTFTKAAASEMMIRLLDTLGSWAVMPVDSDKAGEANLRQTLFKLLGEEPGEAQIRSAQQLFAKVLDSPVGLRILTIHSFCQSILGRFPLEADLQPHFKVMEPNEVADLVMLAQQKVLSRAGTDEMAGSSLRNALENLSRQQSEDQFSKLTEEISKERAQLASILRNFRDVESIYSALCEFYGIRPGMNEESYLAEAFNPDPEEERKIREVALLMREAEGVQNIDRSDAILNWLSLVPEERLKNFDSYRKGYLTDKGTIFANFPSKDVQKRNPAAQEILHAEGRRLLRILDTIKAINSARFTRDILILGAAVNEAYQELKASRGGVDYDDLILKTRDLLGGRTLTLGGLGQDGKTDVTNWIMYKLDQGIEHILVDEAQDTNPEQWSIIESLSDDFFSGVGSRGQSVRTVFAVGDMKQSIYSFQRAAPEEFSRMKGVFRERAYQGAQRFDDVFLNMSFRSTEAVLRVVDSVFDHESMREAMGGESVSHASMREGQGGLVEIWPVIETEKASKRSLWDPPVSLHEGRKGALILADLVAEKIEGWIKLGEVLSAYGRAVQPGDIMILVRSRTALVDAMIRALKLRGIPVSGMDRMNLGPQLVVQDLLAAAKFCLLPSDDLTLACLLKSPFIGWSDNELFALAAGRKGSLWSALVHYEPQVNRRLLDDSAGLTQERATEVTAYLKNLCLQAGKSGVYEFFSQILLSPCPGDVQTGLRAVRRRLGEEALDPLEELLRLALDFGRNQPDALELFVDYFESHPTEIKREMEEAGGYVRIMTVHGSKGLQAPIVILPDCIPPKASQNVSGILWPDKTGLSFPIWAARKDDEPEGYMNIKGKLEVKAAQEDARLLYVAMTRAADRLYICGKKIGEAEKSYDVSWYKAIREGMLKLEGVLEGDDKSLRFTVEQSKPQDKRKDHITCDKPGVQMPGWIYRAPVQEEALAKPLIPSRQLEGDESGDSDVAALSPLAGASDFRFLRGNLTHKLLQILPESDIDKRRGAAVHYVEKNGAGLAREVQDSIVSEVLSILDHPDYSGFFDKNGLSEVPITALLDDRRVLSGQIDRLVVGEDTVWVLDYKTNRPPPERVENVQRVYLRQMRAYRDAVVRMYPQRRVICGLLWTDGARLMILPDSLMDRA